MTAARAQRGMSGAIVLISVALGAFVSPWWLILAAFTGFMLFQSFITGWCPGISFFEKLGLK